MVGEESDCVVVLNPTSGGGDGTDEIRDLAGEYGFSVAVSEKPGEVVSLTREATERGATRIGAW